MDTAVSENSTKGLSGSALKWIAIITMTIDHFAAAVILYMINFRETKGIDIDLLENIYNVSRYIGRIAFPIYCFLIVEGLVHTSNRAKYALRLGIFAIISEIPFDLTIYRGFSWSHQNVFLTLLIGLLTIMAIDRFASAKAAYTNTATLFFSTILRLAICMLGYFAAELLNTDYSGFGVLAIIIMYILYDNKLTKCVIGAVVFAWEVTAPLAFIPIYFYNGKRGRQPKYFFYIYYPAHLVIFYLIRVYLLKIV